MDADDSPTWWDRVSLVALAILAVAWLLIAVTKLTETATGGTAAGVAFALALTVAGLVVVARHRTERSAKLLAGSLFVVGGVATLLSVTVATESVASDVATAVSDVAILSALLVVLALQTDVGKEAIAE